MRDQYWKLNLLQHTAFSMALFQVSEMFNETDKYPLARQTVLAGFITEEEVTELLMRVSGCMNDDKLKMSFADILLLYTAMDLYAKLMLSHKGDTLREQMHMNDPAADPQMKAGFDGLMSICSAFIKSMKKEYGDTAAFKTRSEQLEKLSAFV
jgi:hypothetical protein